MDAIYTAVLISYLAICGVLAIVTLIWAFLTWLDRVIS